LVCAAFMLSKLPPPDWSQQDMLAEPERAIRRWAILQKFVRRFNNILLGILGVLIAYSAALPRGRSWMLLWCVVLAGLTLCLFLAMLDALSSLAGYRQAVPEIARQSFSSDAESQSNDANAIASVNDDTSK